MRTAAPEMCSVGDPMDPNIQEILSLGYYIFYDLFSLTILINRNKF